MNAKETAPLLASAAPLLAAAPPVLILLAVGGIAAWLLTRGDKEEEKEAKPEATPAPSPLLPTAKKPKASTGKKVMLEDLAKIFENGERSLTRNEAVAALQEMGFGKTAAYKALSPTGKFAAWFDYSPDGTIEWQG